MISHVAALAWRDSNQAYLETHLDVLRLMLRRHALYLRTAWKQDPLQPYAGLVVTDEQADRLLAGGETRARREFFARDSEAKALEAAIRAKEREVEAQGRALRDGGRPAVLDLLAQRCGLTALERLTLLLAAAPELDPSFERILGYVQDDVNRRHATPHLAFTLLTGMGAAVEDARETLKPTGPLRRLHLVAVDLATGGTFASARLQVDERMANHLRGHTEMDPRVAAFLPSVTPAPDVHPEISERVAAWTARTDAAPRVCLLGPRASGRRALACAVAGKRGARLHQLDPQRLPADDAARRALLGLIERELLLSGGALFIDLTAVDAGDRAAHLAASEAMARAPGIAILSAVERPPTFAGGLVIALRRPDAVTQARAWRVALGAAAASLSSRVDLVVQQFDFGPESIADIAVSARALADLRAPGAPPTEQELWTACRAHAGAKLDGIAQNIKPSFGWGDIVLPDDVARQLREVADQVERRPVVHEDWNFAPRLARGRGVTALFSGPSGTGKTMAAEVLAAHLGLDLYRVDLPGVISKYIGETEKNLARVFDAAESCGAILFFDEADALFGKRTDVRDSHDRYANIEVDYLLQRMEDYRGLAILATNRRGDLDRAFTRRLRFIVEFPLPDAAHRRRIWQRAFPAEAKVEGLDYDALSRLEIAGGSIRNVAINAAFLAAAEGARIGTRHVAHALRREYAKMERPLTDAEMGPLATHGGRR